MCDLIEEFGVILELYQSMRIEVMDWRSEKILVLGLRNRNLRCVQKVCLQWILCCKVSTCRDWQRVFFLSRLVARIHGSCLLLLQIIGNFRHFL
jgi:hypothetical protein